jgi:hypothetical protein
MNIIRRLPLQILAGLLAAAQAVAAAPPVDVYILTGQSNSLGTTALETDYTPGTNPANSVTKLFWANVTGSVGWPVTLIGNSGNVFKPLQMQQGGFGSPYFWGPEFGFARTLYAAGRTNFVIIKASNAGSGNTEWDKATFNTNHALGCMWGKLSLALLQEVWTKGAFAVRFPRSTADDITWRVQSADSLSAAAVWDTLATKHGTQPWSGHVVVEETDNGSGKLVLVCEPGSPRRPHYLRVQVTRP